MSTGYSWEGIRQVRATLLCARHVPERLCGGYVYLGRYIKCSTFTFTFVKNRIQSILVLSARQHTYRKRYMLSPVRTSICPSVTRVDQSKWLKLGVTFSLRSSPIPVVFGE